MHAHKYLININCLFVLNINFPLVVMTRQESIEEGVCMGKEVKKKSIQRGRSKN